MVLLSLSILPVRRQEAGFRQQGKGRTRRLCRRGFPQAGAQPSASPHVIAG
ncbi:hypothetical protein [Roseomonas sp. BN140053]|uniref:hypothetical protein n=1 Tax=Roseomonas sp. BN140053 TaxID=3391898 RepID=UPI0039EB7431